MIETIQQQLNDIEKEFDVRILWAIESGSRSWGFESPDSDYDVRFIYVNRPDWYLTISERRDVIELPINEVLDISGWDFRKALRLFRKSNPVFIEWLVSPFIYKRSGNFRGRVLELAAECFSRRACSFHYFRMAKNNYHRYVEPKNPVNLKKYFYVLRPLLNILWLKQENSIPPMLFTETLHALDLPDEVVKAVDQLLIEKKKTSEIGKGPRVPVLETFIQKQFEVADQFCETAPVGNVDMEVLNNLFRETIRESWPS